MNQTGIRHDITTAVHQAMDEHLELLSEAAMVRRSDALLATLPGGSGSQPATTAMVLRRYQQRLQQELCDGNQPRATAATVQDELGEVTRAVLLTVGIGEGVSIDVAVGLALVLYKRGVAPFCALPSYQ